jgi:NAD(P)-dependent dehydrogenase (short-subunit alcohol dehydrogenase family)
MSEILITGAGSGFGEGTALGLAQKGHNVIAAVQTWPQVTALREKASSLGLKTLSVEKLDLLAIQGFGSIPMRSLTADRIRSQGIARSFEPRHVPEGTGSAPVRLLKHGTDEHTSAAGHEGPV